MRKGIGIESLFKHSTGNIVRVEDFRIKFLMNFWAKNRFQCRLCGNDFSSFHLLNECEGMKKVEISIYGTKRRQLRLDSQFNHESPNYDFSWILNWCLWKNYFKLIYNSNKYSSENICWPIKAEIKRNELIYLRILVVTLQNKKPEKQEKLLLRTNQFVHGKIANNNQIILHN